jgi:hypothetical protein
MSHPVSTKSVPRQYLSHKQGIITHAGLCLCSVLSIEPLSMMSVKAGLYSILSHKATGVISIYLSRACLWTLQHQLYGTLVSCAPAVLV